MSLIELQSVAKVYPMAGGDVHALRGVSFSAEAGEFLSVVGSSGSGKTTLLYLLGMLTDPSAGNYLFEGRDVCALSDKDLSRVRGRGIGFVFQSFHLLPQVTVLDNVLLSTRYARSGSVSSFTSKAVELLDEVGLGHRLRHRPGELSGGEMQRVAIARALLTEPSVILADEPTGNLDEANGEHVFQILQGLATQGKTVVVVTHDLQLAGRTGRQIRLRDGEVVDESRDAA